MKNRIVIGLVLLSLVSCKDDNSSIDELPISNPQRTDINLSFDTYDQKISYCIGYDNGFTVNQVYNSGETKGKFNLKHVEFGLTDYVGDKRLRMEMNQVDSILDLYLLPDGMTNEMEVSKIDASYAIGLIEAQTLISSLVGRGVDQQMDVKFLLQGIEEGINGIESGLSITEVRSEVKAYYNEANLSIGENFLITNKENPTVKETESGLQYEIVTQGQGKTPNLTDTCLVHYTGRFIDGRVFESTIPSKRPAEFTPLQVIRGMQEGIMLMNEGSSFRLFIPQDLAYGEQGSGPIEPYATLVYDIELIKIKRFAPPSP